MKDWFGHRRGRVIGQDKTVHTWCLDDDFEPVNNNNKIRMYLSSKINHVLIYCMQSVLHRIGFSSRIPRTILQFKCLSCLLTFIYLQFRREKRIFGAKTLNPFYARFLKKNI